MSINPWSGRPIKSVIGFTIVGISLMLPLIFIFIIYPAALRGNLVMIAISTFQIYFQYFAGNIVWEPFMKYLRWIKCENYFTEFTFDFLGSQIEQSGSLFTVHPHNIFTYGMVFNFYYNRFGNKSHILATRSLLMLPGLGLLHKLSGIQGVDNDNVKRLMKQQTNIIILPGGFEEATLTTRKENRIYINNRKGFIKYALQFGYRIYPTFVFGENKIYSTIEKGLNFRLMLNKYKMVGAYFWSHLGLFPDPREKIHTVVGNPLSFGKIENPTSEEVDKCHAKYIEAVKELYYSQRSKYQETSDLKIF